MRAEALGQDARTAWRSLRRAPGFACAALATLALGVGASTAMFSVFRSVLLRPLAFPDSDRLVRVFTRNAGLGNRMAVSYPDYRDWAAAATSFVHLAAYRGDGFALTGAGEPVRLPGLVASAGFFATLGVEPWRGRLFDQADDRPGADEVVVISFAVWRDRFGADPAALGRVLTLDGVPHTLVGILPPDFALPGSRVDALVPLGPHAVEDRGRHHLRVLGRLAPGATLAGARAELAALAARQAADHPLTNAGYGADVVEWRELVVGDSRPVLRLLLAAVGCVALIAAANLANLLLARGLARGGDVAVRSALGASRGSLVRLAVGESLLLSAGGAVLGVGLGAAFLRLLDAAQPQGLARLEDIRLDGMAVVAAIVLALLCGLLAGGLAGWAGSRHALARALRGGGRGAIGDSAGRLARQALVAGEVGAALVLLIGTLLALRSMAALTAVDPGFDARGVQTARLELPRARYDEAQGALFLQRLTARIGALPGVEAAGTADFLPFSEYDSQIAYSIDGAPAPVAGSEKWTDLTVVEGNLFAALRVRLVAGQLFGAMDRGGLPLTLVVDRRFAEANFPDGRVLGSRIRLGDSVRTIIGVVEHVHSYGLDSDPRPHVYAPSRQTPAFTAHLVVRGRDGVVPSAAALRAALAQADPALPLDDVRPLADRVAASLAPRRFSAGLLAAFAVAALFLAAVGIFGVLSYSVTRRTPEVGVRRALGAGTAAVVGLFLREALVLAAAGAVAGCLVAGPLVAIVRAQLYGVSATDARSWFAALGVVLAVAGLAAALPARRAAAVDPAKALRQD